MYSNPPLLNTPCGVQRRLEPVQLCHELSAVGLTYDGALQQLHRGDFGIPLSGVAFYLFALRFKGRNELPQDRSDARALIQFLKGEYFIS